ncbi:MAG: acyl-CoA dehydrogenase [Alphaproteobacteria bacterium]|jgi:alkylation response protein AidB-like acyl-CoA dehydrogenase|nr:acyl-CoA dehydrogenase [Alphaproteobacteria bacterium]
MSEADDIVTETATRIFRDLADPQTINAASDGSWRAPLWSTLEESGLTKAWLDDEHGGAGGSLTDGFAILRVAGAHAVCVPLAETLLAAWLLGRAGLTAPDGAMTVAPETVALNANGHLDGSARTVPFASEAEHIVVLTQDGETAVAALVALADCAVAEGANLAGEPRDVMTFADVAPLAMAPSSASLDDLMLIGAAVRAAQMTGALETVLDIAVTYAGERVAFGRPISRFQAVQHELAKLAGETAAAIAASGAAAMAISESAAFDERLFFEIASAKVRVGEAARDGAAIAHQVHGAIGFTEEHVLQRFSRRMLAWRDDFGSESIWAARLGSMVARAGADALWPTITAA